MTIGFDAKRYYHNNTGLGNYSRAIVSGLQQYYPEESYVLFDERSYSRSFRMGRKAAIQDCDIFHGLSNELPVDIRKAGIPSVVTIHDVAWRTFPKMYHRTDRLIYDYKYGRSCGRADVVLAISESTKRDVMRFYNIPEERIEVIYQPVQELFYTPMSHEEAIGMMRKELPFDLLGKTLGALRPFILNVGSINSRKNLLGLVKALEHIPASRRPLLIAVGNGRGYKREVEKYIAEHNLTNDVHIEGHIRNARLLQALYTEAMIMAYPSNYEGFGLPVVEAALQRCPIITSTVSSLPEAAGPGAVLCDPSEIDSIYEGLTLLLDHPDEAKALGMKAEQYARSSFNPEALTHQLMDLYRKLSSR